MTTMGHDDQQIRRAVHVLFRREETIPDRARDAQQYERLLTALASPPNERRPRR